MVLNKKKNKKEEFDFHDILIQPEIGSSILSRSNISILKDGKLPLIVAPMDTVVDETNYMEFKKRGIIVCSPRNIKTKIHEIDQDVFHSYSLNEFISKFIKNKERSSDKVLIDMANGHMNILIDVIAKFKDLNPKSELMVGNIANPKTFRHLSRAGADYIRVGIGNGAGCLTTQQTGVGFPMASLIKKCSDIKKKHNLKAKIVADGGFKDYSDIIKAIALGADYVMLGSLFNKTLESCSDKYWMGIKIKNKNLKNWLFKNGFKLKNKFRGMSTKEAQLDMGIKNIRTSEGVVKYQIIEYTIDGWLNNFTHYLRTAMSYTDCLHINEFKGNVNFKKITNNAYKRFNK